MPVRRAVLLAVLLLLQALLTACATGPRQVDVPRERVEAALARSFPREMRAAGLLAVQVGVPRLTLLPESNQLRLDFMVDLNEAGGRPAAQASLSMRFALRYEPSDASLRASGVRVDALDVRGLPAALRTPLQLAGPGIAERLLEGVVLHTLRPEDLARARGWTPGAIRVLPQGIRIALQPPVAGAGVIVSPG